MLYFYSYETQLKNEEIISLLKGYKAIVLREDLAVLKDFIWFCYNAAKRDFEEGTNVAHEFALQWLCRISCSRNIKNSVEFAKPLGGNIAIVSGKKMESALLRKLGKQKKIEARSAKTDGMIAGEYSIPEISLVKFDLEQLLKEKSASVFLE